MTNEWQKQLGEAHEGEAVIALVNRYLASWTPEDLRELPEGCARARVEDVEDIRRCAVHLSEVYCDAHAETSPQHRQMLAFFMAALERLTQIQKQAKDGEAALQKLFSDSSRPALFIPKDKR